MGNIVRIFEQNATAFNGMGLGTLLPDACTVSENLNGAYELQMAHPRDEWGKWERLENNRIIVVNTPNGAQPFRIYSLKPDMDGIEINARHIFYDLLDNVCKKIQISQATPAEVLAQIKQNMVTNMPFIFLTDITGTADFAAEMENPVQLLISDSDSDVSFIKLFGGEILRDGYTVRMNRTIGRQTDIVIAYRKNLTGLEVSEDLSDTATRVYPVGADGVTLQGGGYIDSPYVDNYPYPKIRVLESRDATTQAELIQAVNDFFQAGGDLPLVNIKISFIDLSQTVEYASYQHLQDVGLGDMVTIINSKMGFHKTAKVISYEYDSIMGVYTSMELGEFEPVITTAISSGAKSAVVAGEAKNIAQSTTLLINGIATLTDKGLYICVDSTNINTAKRVFWFGQNGLRYTDQFSGDSSTWETVITNSGMIPQSRIES